MIGKTYTLLDGLVFKIGCQGATVESKYSFAVRLEYEYEAATHPTEFDPGNYETFEIWNISPVSNLLLTMPGCIEIWLDSNTKLDYILSDSELERIKNQVFDELKGQLDDQYC